MTSLDEQNLFASGPSEVRTGSIERETQRRGFAGVDGELVLDFGKRSRRVHQRGRLHASTAAGVYDLIAQIESFMDGGTHALVDNHSVSFPDVIVERFEPSMPVRRGRGFWCDYEIVYRQLI